MDDLKPYKPGFGHDHKHYVAGPGDGLNYYGGFLYDKLRLDSEKEAERAASIANIAFEQGYKKCQAEFRKLLGVKV
jgi:hypothetical protein